MKIAMLLEKQPLFYVGIGASAGGLNALTEFFTHLPANTPAAYFVITHLGRNHKSELSQIIGRHTEMPVIPVDRAMPVEAGHIYFLVENTEMVFNKAGIIPLARPKGETNRAVDTFFISLAKYHGRQSVGIILSGGGQDGLAGALAIDKKGGTVLVQDPGSSAYSGMPNAIITNDHPAAILPPAALAEQVMRLVNLVDTK